MLVPKRKFSRQFALTCVYALGLLGLVASGGGSGDGDDSSGTAPSISDLVISPEKIYVGDGGGQIDVSGTFSFVDPDGDLSATIVNVLDDVGQVVFSESIVITGAEGLTSGILQGAVTITTTTPGNYVVQIHLTDNGGNESNILQASFLISEYPWVTRAPMPSPRSGFATAVLNGKIYVIGGRDETAPTTPKPVVDVVEIYDPVTNTWSTGTPLNQARTNQMAIGVNGKIYAIGGIDALETKTVQEFDPGTGSWSLKSDLPYELSSGAVAAISGKIYVAGGRGLGLSSLASLSIYDPTANSWTAGSPMSQGREGNAGTVVDGRFLVYGGYNSSHVPDGGYLRSLESYDPVMDIWTAKSSGEPRRDFGFTAIYDLAYAMGGNNVARSLDLAYAYDFVADSWTLKTPLPSGMDYVRSETIGSKVYVFGTANTYEYTPLNDIR